MVWNSIALVALAALWFYAGWIAPMGAPSRVTALDRAGILDEAKLREEYPTLAQNLRYNLGMWIAEKERKTALLSAGMATVAAAVNVMFPLALGRGKNRPPNGKTDST